MASAMSATLARRLMTCGKSVAPQLAGKRTLHSTGKRQMADHGHGHGHSDGSMYSNDYLHAPHMYDLPHMKNKRLKIGLLVFGSLSIGVSVPIFATHYQLTKGAF